MSNLHPIDSAEAWMRRTDREIGRLKRRRRHGLTSTSISTPPMMQGVSANDGIGQITFTWDGSVEEGRVLPDNFHYVEVYASDGAVSPVEEALIGVITTPEGGQVVADLGDGEWFIAARIRTTSKAVGPLSLAVVANQTGGDGVVWDGIIRPEDIIEGQVVTTITLSETGAFVAPSPDGSYTQMVSTGVEHWIPGDEGTTNADRPAVRVSRFGRDLQFVVPGADGGIFGMNETGDGTMRGLSTEEDPRIAGTPLLGTLLLQNEEVSLDTDRGHLDALAFAGNYASWNFGTASYPWSNIDEKTVGEVMREQQAGRAVAVILSARVRFATPDVGNAFQFRIRKTQLDLPTSLDPDQPTTSSTVFNSALDTTTHVYAQTTFTKVMGLYTPSRSEKARWLVTIARRAGSSAYRIENMVLLFLDIGPASNVSLDTVDRVVADAAPAPPPVTPKKTYVSRWYASTITRAQGSVPTSPSDRAGQALQGWHTTFSGDPFHSILGFTGQAHFGESGRTLNAALAGATIDKVRIRLTMANTYPGTQGRLGIQASSSAVPTPIQNTVVMTNGQTLYTIMGSAFRTGLANGMRYITLGPGPELANSYAAFHGTSGGNAARAELEVTYTR